MPRPVGGVIHSAFYLGENLKLEMLVESIYLVSKRFLGTPTFFNYAITDGFYNLLFPDNTDINIAPKNKSSDFKSVSTSVMKRAEYETQETLKKMLIRDLRPGQPLASLSCAPAARPRASSPLPFRRSPANRIGQMKKALPPK